MRKADQNIQAILFSLTIIVIAFAKINKSNIAIKILEKKT
jgi:hypothetical protein